MKKAITDRRETAKNKPLLEAIHLIGGAPIASKLTDTPVSTIYGWINHGHRPDPHAIGMIADETGTDYRSLMTGVAVNE